MEKMTPLSKLSEIYIKWIDKNKLKQFSADEVLLGTPDLTIIQTNWLKRFIEIWDRTENNEMKKNILVKFDLQIGDYQHQDICVFNKKKSDWGYCKEFWGINKKDELKENCFWDNESLNAISVYSETEITNAQAKTLMELGVA